MIRLDHRLLVDLGYRSLTVGQADRLLKHLYDTLERNVGAHLSEEMSDAQLDAFGAFFDAKDDAGALAWLERNFPNYKDMVNDEFEALKKTLVETAEELQAETP